MNLNSLKYFIEVADTKSFTKASERLYVSQPGISQQIDSLEKQLGVKLLLRTTRNVDLTEEGRYLYEKIRGSFHDIENTVSNLTEETAFPGLINIATIPSAASLYIPLLLKEARDLDLKIEFLIKEVTSSNAVKYVDEGHFHLGFIRTGKDFQLLKDHQMDFIEFKGSPIKAIVSKEHELASRSTIKLDELKNDYFIQHNKSDSNALFNQLEKICATAGFKPKTLCSGPELLTISNIIANNLAIALMPENIYHTIPKRNLIALDLEDVYIENSIVAIWKDDGYINPNLKLLIMMLRQFKQDHEHEQSV